MGIHDIIERARTGFTAGLVFGESVRQDGVVVIPAVKISGGGGGGEGSAPGGEGGEGFGGGFGVHARPAGAFVIRDGGVRWRPAVDVNLAIGAGAALGVAALLLARTVVKARTRSAGHRSPARPGGWSAGGGGGWAVSGSRRGRRGGRSGPRTPAWAGRSWCSDR
jgi:hypothetical protein